MDVIKRLNSMRLERNMSVYRLAELSGLNQSTLANTFSRGTVPSIRNLEMICEALGCTLAQFFAKDEEYMELTQQERDLMNNYRKLPESIRSSIATIVNTIPDIQN